MTLRIPLRKELIKVADGPAPASPAQSRALEKVPLSALTCTQRAWAHAKPSAWGIILKLVLRLVITRFATIRTVVLTILAKPHAVVRLAQSAITVAGTAYFRLVADHASKFFPCHRISASWLPPRQELCPLAPLSCIDRAKSTAQLQRVFAPAGKAPYSPPTISAWNA